MPNLTRDNALDVSKKICFQLDELNIKYIIEEKNYNVFCGMKADFLNEKEMLEKSDIVIAVGGDGTIISCAKKALEFSKPVLGVNAGRVAFMAGLEPTEIDRLKCLITSDYKIDRRMMLEVSSEAVEERVFCINDAFAGRARHINMAEIEVRCDNNLINQYYADGVIVSTPTGSTAYSLSAGGPVIDPQIESIMITPVCTHSLFSRSLIFKRDCVIEIINRNRNGDDILLSCDGGESYIIPVDKKITIRRAEKSANFIRIKSDTFVDILNDKLSQRRA